MAKTAAHRIVSSLALISNAAGQRQSPMVASGAKTGGAVVEHLDAFFPARTFLAPRVCENTGRWFPSDPVTVEFVTGHSLGCAGGMPIICHRATISPVGLSAMSDAGIEIAADRLAYTTQEQYAAHVRSLTSEGWKAVTPFWTPADIVPPADTWIPPALLQFLNNKANMGELVPPGCLPARDVVGGDAVEAIHAMALPRMLKAATNLPNGGGDDVMICRHSRHRRRAAERFREAGAVILEELLDIRENYCVQYASFPDGCVSYIGESSQICLANGAHSGNLLDPAGRSPPEVVELGRTIAIEGARRGFNGIAGFDIVRTRDGRTLAIDLNFRMVSSTAQVLLHPRLSAERGMAISRLAFCRFSGPLPEMLLVCRPFIESGWLVPLATFDPIHGQMAQGDARSRFLIFGNSVAEIEAREKMLVTHGIEIAGEPRCTGPSRVVKSLLHWFHTQGGVDEKA